MPAKSDRQQLFMRVELGKARKGQPRRTNMTIKQLKHFTNPTVVADMVKLTSKPKRKNWDYSLMRYVEGKK